MTKHQPTFILIHSAWLGAWQWEAVSKLLVEKGYTVKAPDLPGHGDDKTPPNQITMESYLDKIYEYVQSCDAPVVLVGHSFNGITISQFAEIHHSLVQALVYVAGFLLPNGKSFLDVASGVVGSKAVENFYINEYEPTAMVRKEVLHEAFAHDVPLDAFEAVAGKIVPEPVKPLQYPLLITDRNFGSVPAFYIECTEDKAVPLATQQDMHEGRVKRVYSIKSSHTPNFSHPSDLADILIDVAHQLV